MTISTAPEWPLKESDCDCLDNILQQIAVLQEAVRKCQNCNMPVQDQAQRLEATRQFVAGIKSQFFPNRP